MELHHHCIVLAHTNSLSITTKFSVYKLGYDKTDKFNPITAGGEGAQRPPFPFGCKA